MRNVSLFVLFMMFVMCPAIGGDVLSVGDCLCGDLPDTDCMICNDFEIPSEIDIDLEGVITLLFEILTELRYQSDLLQAFDGDIELLRELLIQSQYQMGLLAIVVGIALGFVFVFGMRLH